MQIYTTEKEYVCECGKLFYNSQSFNGHKCHCKVHRLAKNGEADYEAYLLRQAKTSTIAQEARRKQAAEAREAKQQVWASLGLTCEHCGKTMTVKYGIGRFCSSACAKARVHSDETKQKIKRSLESTLASQSKSIAAPKHACNICGTKIKSQNKTGFCINCLRHSPEGLAKLSELGKQTYVTSKANGTHKGWQSRNIISYAEQFWIQVLDNNNIDYQREVPVKHDKSNYFLDFVLEHNGMLIDLEIDDKQHTYEDRIKSDVIRDLYLTKQGYLVYRVAWNEISSEVGAQAMKEKIEAFLTFYNSL